MKDASQKDRNACFSVIAGGKFGYEFREMLGGLGLAYSKTRHKWWVSGLTQEQAESLHGEINHKTDGAITIVVRPGDYDPLLAPNETHHVRTRWKAVAADVATELSRMEQEGASPAKLAVARGALATIKTRDVPESEKRRAVREVAELRGVFNQEGQSDSGKLRAMNAGELMSIILKARGIEP